MSFLVDTCALSELIRPAPAPQVVGWFEQVPPEALFISALTIGEIRKGAEKLADGRRKNQIITWLEIRLPEWFEDRVLAVDAAVADEWGRMVARMTQSPSAIDGLIAATAIKHRLTVVTRNVLDFQPTGVDVINPWNQ